MQISEQQLDDLALGAVFLATGGGGDPYVPLLLTKQAVKTYGPVALMAAQDCPDDAHVVTIGGVGAPTVSLELLPSLREAEQTLLAYEQHIGRAVEAVVSFEIGGGNSLIPIMAAAARGIPVIDGDGMGRALPEAQMMTYPICGVKPTPAVAYDYEGNVTSFTTKNTSTYERHIRSLAMSSGGMITTAEHPMSGHQLKQSVIPGTLSFSIRLGQVLRHHRGNAMQMLAPLQQVFADSIYGDCQLLYTGKVTDKATRIVGGYDVGVATVSSFDHSEPEVTIDIKNEYLVASQAGKVLASVPDLIVVVDYETSEPINAERLRYGQRVAVFAVGCPAFFRQPAALEVVHPRCFGFDIEYCPL